MNPPPVDAFDSTMISVFCRCRQQRAGDFYHPLGYFPFAALMAVPLVVRGEYPVAGTILSFVALLGAVGRPLVKRAAP